LEAAANAAWPYALLCAWTFLDDHAAAYDLMDHAIQNSTEYVARHPNATSVKVRARVKSEIRRHAKYQVNRQRREYPNGLAADFEAMCACQPDIEQHTYATEIFAGLAVRTRDRQSALARIFLERDWAGPGDGLL
jgi:hypothetical protein